MDSAHRVTPTLIALIVLFTILVTPSNVIVFVRTASGAYKTFETAARLANFFLLSNFAVNFVLYLVINAEFRRATRDLVTCRCTGQADHLGGDVTGVRSDRWRHDGAGVRRTLKEHEMHQGDTGGGVYCMDTDQQRQMPNPAIIVTGDTNVDNFSETEIAL